MSRAAQEVQRAVDEMMRKRKRPAKKERSMAGDSDDDEIDTFDEIDASDSPVEAVETATGSTAPPDSPAAQTTTATAEGDTTMAKKTKRAAKARKTTARKPKATKKTTARTKRAGKIEIPASAEGLTLEPNGIRTEAKNRYVNVYFVGGLVIRLLPANLDVKETARARDLIVEWLNRRLS